MSAGTLYVVATPLGNLQDLSERARHVLSHVAIVAAEDTRRTKTLLSHLGASPRTVSYHAHSTPKREAMLLAALERGDDVALVTDAGTPGVSDPGVALVRAARHRHLQVTAVPGPSAVTAALSFAGLPADRYSFLGFLPRRGTERRHLLEYVRTARWTCVVFEAPGRLVALLHDLARVCGDDREVAVAREISKLHEELKLGTISELAGYYAERPPRGEVTVLVAGAGEPADRVSAEAVATAAQRLLARGETRKDVAKRLAAELELPRNEVYRIVSQL